MSLNAGVHGSLDGSTLREYYDVIVTEENGVAHAYTNKGKYISHGTTHGTIMQAAINSLPSAGTPARQRVVRIRGAFNVESQVSVPSHIVMDMRGSSFFLTADITSMFTDTDSPSDTCAFIGGHFNGDREHYGSRTTGSCIDGEFKNSEFNELYIECFDDYGIRILPSGGATNGNRFIQCWIGGHAEGDGCKLGGLVFGAGGLSNSDHIIEQSYFINNGDYNILFASQAHTCRIENCHFAGWSAWATETKGIGLTGSVWKFQILNCHFEQIMRQAIVVQPTVGTTAEDLIMIGNNFYDVCRKANNTYSAIDLNALSGTIEKVTIDNNTFTTDLSGYAPQYNISVQGTFKDIKIGKGNVYGSGSYVTSIFYTTNYDNIQLPWSIPIHFVNHCSGELNCTDAGWLVDAAGEHVRSFGYIPIGVTNVERIMIHGIANAADAQGIAITFDGHAARVIGSGETRLSNDVDEPLTCVNGTATGFGCRWVLSKSIDSLSTWTGGDSYEIYVGYIAATSGAVATNAYIRGGVLECV